MLEKQLFKKGILNRRKWPLGKSTTIDFRDLKERKKLSALQESECRTTAL